MKKTLLYGLAAAVGLTGLAEAPLAWAKQSSPSQGVRADIRADALQSLARGDVQEVANRKATNRKVKRKRYRARGPAPLRSVHSRGRWCGKGRWYGKRCYYTPSGLRPFRQR